MHRPYKDRLQQSIRLLGRPAGWILVGISFGYILNRLWIHSAEILQWKTSPGFWGIIGLCAVSYGCSGFLLSSAWRQLLALYGHKGMRLRQSHVIYGYTQIAKYIPGNIFHFTGRHIMGRQAGIRHLVLVSSALYEVLGILFAAAVMAVPGLFIFDSHRPGIAPFKFFLLFGAIALILLFTFAALPRLTRLRGLDLPVSGISQLFFRLLPAYGLYIVFFCVAGIILNGVVYAVMGTFAFKQGVWIVSVFSIAWIAGFITPGASAGIGVRETTLMICLSPMFGEAPSLAIAMLSRVVTVMGDLVFFLMTYLLRSGIESAEANDK